MPLTIQNNGTGNSFVVNDVASDTTPFVIDASGNVGIGTTSPSAKLEILSDSASLSGLNIRPHSAGLTATITNAVQSAGVVTYTATNTFTAGQQVTITGITPTTFNVTNAVIKTATGSSFTVSGSSLGGTYASGGTATAYANLQEWDNNAGAAQVVLSQTGKVTAPSTELVMEQTGDTYGSTRLRLQNRDGQNGPLFDTSLSTVDLVDFGFKSASSQGQIRFEARAGYSTNVATTGPEFQIGNTTNITTGSNPTLTNFPLIVGASLWDRRVQINSTTGSTVPLTIKSIPTLTATITGATVTTFANKSGTIITPQGPATLFSRITGIASTTGLLPGMILTYVSGVGTFGGGTAKIISVDTATSISVFTTAATVAGATIFSIQNSVTYTATNSFAQTQNVTITGASAGTLNVTNATIGAVTGGASFTVINTTASGTWTSGGTATITQSSSLTDWVGSAGTSVASIDASGNLTALGATFNTNATGFVKQAATVAPTVDMFQITNTGFANVTAGVSALQVNYVGGAAAVEASAARIDVTPGTTTGGTWNGFRVIPTATATTGVTYNAMKFDAVTAGLGTDNVIYVGTGYDNILNYNGTSVINGSGQLNLASVTGTLAATNGGTAQSTYATGDIVYASASNTLSKRTIGTTGQVLTVAGGVPTWADSAGATSADITMSIMGAY